MPGAVPLWAPASARAWVPRAWVPRALVRPLAAAKLLLKLAEWSGNRWRSCCLRNR